MRDLPMAQRRQLDRRLRRMAAPQRERFFHEWSRLSLHERRELAARLAPDERRSRRELPPRLRTPEMRERLGAMSLEERREFVARARRWREMDPAERHRMRKRLERFGALSAEQQQALVDERFSRKSPEERARILSGLRSASKQMRELRESRGAAEPADPSGAEPARESATPAPLPPPAP
jgi:hypothetical protein